MKSVSGHLKAILSKSKKKKKKIVQMLFGVPFLVVQVIFWIPVGC